MATDLRETRVCAQAGRRHKKRPGEELAADLLWGHIKKRKTATRQITEGKHRAQDRGEKRGKISMNKARRLFKEVVLSLWGGAQLNRLCQHGRGRENHKQEEIHTRVYPKKKKKEKHTSEGRRFYKHEAAENVKKYSSGEKRQEPLHNRQNHEKARQGAWEKKKNVV